MYKATEKQLQAIKNMMSYCWHDPDAVDEYYEDRTEFQKTFEFYLEKCKQKEKSIAKWKRINNAIESWRITRKEINEKRDLKLKTYYNNKENLKKSLETYFYKYFPSEKKLFENWIKKSNNKDLTRECLLELGINDYDTLHYFNSIKTRLQHWESDYKIILDYLKKWFEREAIVNYLTELKEFIISNEDSLSEKYKKEVDKLIKVGYSNESVYYNLKSTFIYEKRDVLDYIDQRLEEIDINLNEIISLVQRYHRKWKSRFEIGMMITWKWYRRDLVNEVLDNLQIKK